MNNFTPLSALAGGALIGLASAALLVVNGRIAGISGILSGALSPRTTQKGWRLAFLAGLLAGGLVVAQVTPAAFGAPVLGPAPLLVAGVLVGLGARVSGGCTSGHGVCGLGRLSKRSLVAVVTFMATGAAAALAARLLGVTLS
jgi:uncharacterized membrane protein YedE/YeeE